MMPNKMKKYNDLVYIPIKYRECIKILCMRAHQSCLTLCDLMDCSLLGSSVHGIFQTRTLEGVAISFSRGSSSPRDGTHVSFVSYISRQFIYH